MKFLIDTDIILSLGPGGEENLGIHPYSAVCFQRLARESGCSLFVHPLTLDAVDLGYPGERANQIKEQMAVYDRVDTPVPLSVFEQDQVGFPKTGSSDYLENAFLAAVKTDAIDFLVTEKISLHERAGRFGLSTRVLFLSDALGLVRDLFKTVSPGRPRVEKISFLSISDQDAIFWTMVGQACDQEAFNELLAQLRAGETDALVIRDGAKAMIAGICVVEQQPECLKIPLFHVPPPYPFSRYGALLLKAVFEMAVAHGDGQICFPRFPGHGKTTVLVHSLGFKGTNPMSIQAVSFTKNNTWILPLTPLAHETLFPELEPQLPLFPYSGPQGNAIEKVCLFHTPLTGLTPGDALLIYRTRGPSAVTAMGVVQGTLVASCPHEVIRFLGTGTAWNHAEMVRFCRSSPLVIKFWHVKTFRDPLVLSVLKEQGVLTGHPRGIIKVKDRGTAWLQKTLVVNFPV